MTLCRTPPPHTSPSSLAISVTTIDKGDEAAGKSIHKFSLAWVRTPLSPRLIWYENVLKCDVFHIASIVEALNVTNIDILNDFIGKKIWQWRDLNSQPLRHFVYIPNFKFQLFVPFVIKIYFIFSCENSVSNPLNSFYYTSYSTVCFRDLGKLNLPMVVRL